MVYIQKFQTNFTSGELSPFCYARTDLKQYDNSARSIQNFIVRPQGGIEKRPGTVYVAGIKNSANYTRLIPFIYSNIQTYVIEFGAGYFRFFKNGGEILSTAAFTNGAMTSNITGWTTDNTGTGTAVWDASNSGSMKLSGGASGVGGAYQAVSFVGTNTYHLSFTCYTNTVTYKIGTSQGASDIATGTAAVGANNIAFTPTTDGTVYFEFTNSANNNAYINNVALDNPVYQIANPYQQADLDNIQFAQSFDTIFLVNNNYPVKSLTRTGHAQWTITNTSFTGGPWYDKTDTQYGGIGTGFTLAPSGTGAGSSVTFTASGNVFVSTDVGRFIRFRSTSSAAWGWATITAYTSPTSVTATINKNQEGNGLDATTASKEWQLGAFSATTGYPGAIGFNDQRLVLGNTSKQQQTVWFSNTGSVFKFYPDSDDKDTVTDSSAMTFTIAGNSANIIYWFAPGRVLFIGTSGGVWQARASTLGEALTPINITVTPAIKDSCSTIPGIILKNALLYVQQYQRKFYEISYVFYQDIYQAEDLAKLAEHRTHGNIKWVQTQLAPNYLIWVLNADGTLSCITYLKEENIVAWHQHILGGTNVQVKSIACIPGTAEDQVWMIVQRTVNGQTVQYVEYFTPSFLDAPVTSASFLDSSATYSGVSTTTISGLTWLEGQTVQCFSNGYQVTVTTPVTGGAITLQQAVTSATVGLPYTSQLTTNQFNIDSASNTVQGRIINLNKVDFRFYDSYGGQVSADGTNYVSLPYYSDSTIMGSPVTLFSGDYTWELPSGGTRTPLIYFQHSLPLPCHLLGLVYKASVAPR